MQLAVKYFIQHPFDDVFWRPRIYVTGSKFLFITLTIIQQVLPAIFVDSVLKALGTKNAV